jgi:DNA-binding response OmpR family regulator
VRILVVEDDDRVAWALHSAMRRQGHEVCRVASAASALAAPPADVVLLDLALPDGDGIEVCTQLRRRGEDTAIIAVTARGDDRSRVTGLRAGADDYLVKPFSVAELLARIEAVLRRTRARPGPTVQAGPLWIDFSRREVTCHGRPVVLTPKEFDLLLCLARHPGGVVSREQLLVEVWRTAWRGAGHTLQVHVATLRAKLGDPGMVETVRGIGYRLAVAPTEAG